VKTLLVGYSADAEIILDAHENVLRVPTQALLEGNRVLVVNDGVLHERHVQTGISNWQVTEVISGLRQGEKVVLSVERKGVVPGAKAVVERK
jgi:HlyD family secretion protein